MCIQKKCFSKDCSEFPGSAKREQTERDEDVRSFKWLVRDLENENSQ